MFTGIVDHCGTIQEVEQTPGGARITIQTQFSNFALGESIAVDGVCLTLVENEPSSFTVELSPETLEKTTAKHWEKDSSVNLERALKVGDRLGGHWVTGHVDTSIKVKVINGFHDYREIIFSVNEKDQLRYLVKKGSVAINGVSLTINDVFDDGFSVMLIPHTQERTNLSEIKPGSFVNIEFDYLLKGVVRSQECYESKK